MEKIFNILAQKDEIKSVKRVLKEHHISRRNVSKSKVFSLQGLKVVSFTLVTDEDTFTSIVAAMNGQRIY